MGIKPSGKDLKTRLKMAESWCCMKESFALPPIGHENKCRFKALFMVLCYIVKSAGNSPGKHQNVEFVKLINISELSQPSLIS